MLGLNFAEKLADRHPESFGQPFDVHQADVALAPFDRTDIRPVKVGLVGQGFLGQALGNAHFAQSEREVPDD